MRTLLPIGFASLLLGAALPAQTVAGSFAPNPAPPGVTVTFTGTDATGLGLNLPSPCTWYRIHQGSQTGPIVQLGVFCPSVIVPIPPNGTFQFSWDQRDASGQLVPPGNYWLETRVWDPAFSALQIDWFCISIQPAGVPALTAAGPARLGLSTALQLSAPAEPNALYVVAASLTSNAPFSFAGLDTCLTPPIHLEPFTVPIGLLDASGNSSGLALLVPGSPSALWQGLHVQGLVFGAAGLQLTNDLSLTVQP
jgi:hypothetical protein